MTNTDLNKLNQSGKALDVECSRSDQSNKLKDSSENILTQSERETDHESVESVSHSAVEYEGDIDVKCLGNDHAEMETSLTSRDKDDQFGKKRSVYDDVRLEEERAYGWVVMLSSLFVFMMYGANWVMFTVYIVDFSELFDKPQAYIGAIGSVDSAMSQFTALPAGAFVSLYGCRPVCLIGLVVYAIGTLSSAFTNNFYTLLFTFGFIKGLGAGMIFIPCSVIVQQYFSRRRAMAVAFASSGLSIGAMAFSPIHRLLIHTFGWRGGLIFFSAIVLQGTVCAALMRPPRLKNRSTSASVKHNSCQEITRSEDTTWCRSAVLSVAAVLRHLQKALNITFLKNPKLLLFLSIKTFGITGVVTAYKFCIARAVHLGVDKFYASFLVTAIGINSCVFRWIGGLIGNSRCADRLALYTISSTLAGLMIMLSVFVNSTVYSHLLAYFTYGAFLGLAESMQPVIASDLFGIEKLPSTLGWLMAFTGITIFIYMPFFGFIFDLTQSYNIPFLLGGAIQVTASCMGYVIMYLNRKEKKCQQMSIVYDVKVDSK